MVTEIFQVSAISSTLILIGLVLGFIFLRLQGN